MGDYNFVTDKISLSGVTGENIFVEGYAIAKGIDSYNTSFSDACMKSIGEQLVKKDVRVSSQHYNALTAATKMKLDELRSNGGDENVIAQMESLLQSRNFADAVIVDGKFDGNGVFLKTKLNKYLEKVDKPYFDALFGQLQDGFLNGMSIEFDPSGAKAHKKNVDGKLVTVFDYVPIKGVSFVSNASNPNSRITDVAVRMANIVKGEEMVDEKVPV